jgi:hypothetical protein
LYAGNALLSTVAAFVAGGPQRGLECYLLLAVDEIGYVRARRSANLLFA